MSTFFEDCIQAQIDRARASSKEQDWRFEERSPANHTIGDLIRAILAVNNEEDARRLFEGYVTWLSLRFDLKEPAETVARANIGWCFGEGMAPERQAMWVKVCQAAHPIFGISVPSAEEAFRRVRIG